MSLDFVCFNLLFFDNMEPTIRFVNSNNQNALHEEAEDVDISQWDSIHSPIDIENDRQVVTGQEVCNSVLTSQM